MKTSGPSKCLIVLATFVLHASPARAQEWVHLDPLKWEAKVEFETTKEQIQNSGPTRDSEVKTGVIFKQSGFVLDPRIAKFSIKANPIISRGKFNSTTRNESRAGELLDFNARLDVLEGAPQPFSANLMANHTTNTTDAGLGSQTDLSNRNEYLGLNWKNRAFPSTLSISDRSMQQSFQSGLTNTTSERNEAERAITFRGRSSKMDVFAEHLWHDDKIPATDQDYTNDRFRLHNLFRWGKGSRFDSRIEYLKRVGFRGYDRLTVGEQATLEHTRALSSSYAYRYSSFSQDQETTEHIGDFTLTHNLFDTLITTLRFEGRASDLGVSTESEYKGRIDSNYRRRILWGGRLTAGLGGGYGVTNRVSSGGLSEVVDEFHSVDSSYLVLLVRRFIETSTIVVTDATGSFVFSEGTDYTVIPADNNLTQISIIAGGMINVGDTILVSYKYQALPSAKFSTIPYQAHVAFDFDWISVFARVSGEKETLIDGVDEDAVTDRFNASVGVELNWNPSPDLNGTFSAARRTAISGEFNSNSINFNQSLFYRLNARTALNLTANQDFISSDGQQTNFFGADLGLRWQPWRKLSVMPHIGTWMRDEKGVSEEKFLTGGVDMEYSIGLVDLRFGYTHERRSGTITGRSEDRIMLTIIRKSQ